MVLRERIADHVFVFRSGLYAQVNAGLVTTNEGCIVIDTLPFPQETQEIIDFVHRRLRSRVRFLVLTHSHADHVYGAYLFPEAEVVGHLLCRDLMIKQTRPALIEARQRHAALAEVSLHLPSMLVEKEATLRLGDFTVTLRHSPGHSPDVITVYVKEEKVLFASDTVMPAPYFINGNINDFRRSLREIMELSPVEDVVQGHGDVLLRGEVNTVLQTHLDYLDKVEAHARAVAARGGGKEELETLTLDECGLSRIALNGFVQQMHKANLYFLLGQARKQQRAG
ncbi:MAG: MBL fold metallo-hydrolase [Caldilineales bacterium]|nr:MBL fold metallo-hydrolase [Caldilineales bacterium]